MDAATIPPNISNSEGNLGLFTLSGKNDSLLSGLITKKKKKSSILKGTQVSDKLLLFLKVIMNTYFVEEACCLAGNPIVFEGIKQRLEARTKLR